jgi:hypothetical protein
MREMKARYLMFTLLLATLASQSGCQWMRQTFRMQDPQPMVLRPSAGLEEIIAAVNKNNSQIQSLSSSSATLKSPGFPTLNAKLAYQRPCFFRMKASFNSLMGDEVDLGSNAELFWFWVKRNPPPALYYCRHDQFANSRAREMLPIQPNWLVESLGTLEIDPNLHHDGPYPEQGNRVRIRTIIDTPDGGKYTKITVIDAVSAWVMEQQIYDGRGQLRAKSVAEGYHRDPTSGLYVPTAVQVECPPMQFSMRIDLGNVQVNQPVSNGGELWTLPSIPSARLVDLGRPNAPIGPPPGVAAGR